MDALKRAARLAGAKGVTLCLENEPSCWAGTAGETAAFVRAVDEPNLGITWDPANAALAGERAYPDGYELIADLVRHVHFKDASRDPSGRRQFALDGVVDWKGQMAALRRDGYKGFISVETHLRPKLEMTEQRISRLRTLIDES